MVITKYSNLLKVISDKILQMTETPLQETILKTKNEKQIDEIVQAYEFHLTILTKMKTLLSLFLSKRLLTTSIESFISTIDLVLFSLEKKIYKRLSADVKCNPPIRKTSVKLKTHKNINFSVGIFPCDKSHHSLDEYHYIGYHTFRVFFIEGSKIPLNEVGIHTEIKYRGCECVSNVRMELSVNKTSAIYVNYDEIAKSSCQKHSSSVKKITMKRVQYSNKNQRLFSTPISMQPTYVVKKNTANTLNVMNCVNSSLSFFTKNQNSSFFETPCMLFNVLYSTFFSRDLRVSSTKILPYSTAMLLFSSISNNHGFTSFSELIEIFSDILFKFVNLIENNLSFRKLWMNGAISFPRESFTVIEKCKKITNPKVMTLSPSLKSASICIFDFSSKTKKVLVLNSWEELAKLDFVQIFNDYFQTTKRNEHMIVLKREATTEENAKEVFDTFKYGVGVDTPALSSIYSKTTDICKVENIEQITN